MSLKKKIITIAAIIFGILIIFAIALPSILKAVGLHPSYASKQFNLENKKALIITTSHGILNAPGKTTGKATGVFASEMTVPYYEFLDANMDVDVASIKGGKIPIDPMSFLYMIKTKADTRYLKDKTFQQKVNNSLIIDDIDFTKYDAIFLAGGWGAAYDLGYSKQLGEKISEAYYAKTPIIGSVCHGALGLIQAQDTTGNLLIKGREITGVTNKQLEELGITITPQHPEAELKQAGAIYKSNSGFRDMFQNLTVIDKEKRFVTGQNQNAGHETAQKIMKIILDNS
ncbi:MAG: type 1 glutamine amidotransferase domain-containing protein [Saprospiraceae bacterium]|jgi:putative intracellular protease/amidase|nr:type 1 glutamine amidotransferase domain-containing protein [Saprospiraceae bacterium]